MVFDTASFLVTGWWRARHRRQNGVENEMMPAPGSDTVETPLHAARRTTLSPNGHTAAPQISTTSIFAATDATESSTGELSEEPPPEPRLGPLIALSCRTNLAIHGRHP